MLPFRTSEGATRRRVPQSLDRVFAGTPIGVSATGTYGTLFSPLPPAVNTQLARAAARTPTSAAEMKQACGLPEQIADFIINISAADLNTSDQTSAANAAADNHHLVPSTAAPAPATGDSKQDELVFWPSTLRPRAVIDQSPEPFALSPSLSLVPWTRKTELMSLPTELREIIYEMLLEPSASTKTTVPANDTTATVRLVVPNEDAAILEEQARALRGAKSLLKTNKQLRSEFLPFFAARYSYKFTRTAQLLCVGLPHRPLGALSLHWTQLQHVELSIDASVRRAADTRAFLQLGCLAIYLLPALKTLTITQLPAAFSPVRFYAGQEGAALAMDTYRCRRLARYGDGTAISAKDFALDVYGVPGWRAGFYRFGEILQGWMRSEGEEEFALFGHVYRVGSGGEVTLALTLQTEGKWRKVRREKERAEKAE